MLFWLVEFIEDQKIIVVIRSGEVISSGACEVDAHHLCQEAIMSLFCVLGGPYMNSCLVLIDL